MPPDAENTPLTLTLDAELCDWRLSTAATPQLTSAGQHQSPVSCVVTSSALLCAKHGSVSAAATGFAGSGKHRLGKCDVGL